mmetsp:Transcript_11869/g.25055  ORF Transcript_11869/g.25055 Transcript_11869/m.25055 type:complete len:149 (-) Transcript_11869:155-601(-)
MAAVVRRRRILLAAALILTRRRILRVRRARRREQLLFNWQAHSTSLNDHEFRLRYRLSRPAFYKLLDAIQKDLSLSDTGMKNTVNAWGDQGGAPIMPVVRLAAALRIMAGASYLDVQKIYGMKHDAVYKCLWQGGCGESDHTHSFSSG